MEKKFNNLLKKTKAHSNYETEASNTFEFDLFSQSSWFLTMNELDLIEKNNNIVASHPSPIEIKETSHEILKKEPFKVAVLFIGDTVSSETNEEDLLAKMIKAMKLKEHEYIRLPFDHTLEQIIDLEDNLQNPKDNFKELLNNIEALAPQYVVSLGATVTNLILGSREKMSAIHGKFLKSSANSWEFQLMPLFHPDFLLINPNMKRTAWIDLQKLMECLGKI
jgi:hypothetical protein